MAILSTKPILIIVSTFNRRDLTGLSLDSIRRNKSTCSDVLVLDDASTEYDAAWLKRWNFAVVRSDTNIGVGLAAFRRYREFLDRGYAYLCALDNDVLLAKDFDLRMLKIFCEADDGKLTVASGYLSCTQNVFTPKFVEPPQRTLWQQATTINGISQFTDRATALKVLDAMEGKWEHPWDRNISEVLSRVAVPFQSLVEHLGIYGTGVNGVSQDVAVNFVGDGK